MFLASPWLLKLITIRFIYHIHVTKYPIFHIIPAPCRAHTVARLSGLVMRVFLQWKISSLSCMRPLLLYSWYFMMTSSNGCIFRVNGLLCGEFTGPGEFPAQRPVTRSFDGLFDLRLNKRLSKQPWGWWFETPSWSLRRQCNVYANVAGSVDDLMIWNKHGPCVSVMETET